jgi:DNA-binding HxlR family transcriptional regulator
MSRPPKAGGSSTAKPMMALFDLIGRRWALRILWELRTEMLTFRALQERCGNPSPTVLNARLQELCEGALVDRSDGEGYTLTGLGREVTAQLLPLVRLSERWADLLRRG